MDDDYPCTSKHPWQLGPADTGSTFQRNIRCEAVGVLIAVNLPHRVAQDIVEAHNGGYIIMDAK